ncbi:MULTISPECIES: NHLP bacteriocin export ABC transporter permease/ATPase subunit [unclassified Streptomyces]|uniref:NHLP bacteriocin export ABC transporter permease/ATPase subunit n=1 Tax=unclassified Streptomyces TaxID=2593676 RepID=UPI00068C1DA4|nr:MULTISPECIES: NHLP bacteriocin export ABC transporter permease/ATPase subunit [unclassified Streptomyces]
MITSAFAPFFSDAATPADLDTDPFTVLDDVRRVLLVESGAVDLFAVRLVDGVPTGRWNFLARVEAGALLMGSPSGPRHGIVGRPVPDTVLSYLPLSHLEGLSARRAACDTPSGLAVRALSTEAYGDAVQQFLDGLEQGIVALAQALRDTLPPREFVPLSTDGPTELAAGAAVRSVDGVRWVRVEEGSVELGEGVSGRFTTGMETCLTQRDWLIADSPARLRARSSRELLDEGALWGLLLAHATRLLYTVDRRIEGQRGLEREALDVRQAHEAGTLAATARSFEAVLHDTEARIRLADVAADPPTLAAARLVAAHQGFAVKAPLVGSGHGRNLDDLQSIAHASGVRTRAIRLDGRWWRTDFGPAIGYRKVGDRPVALLPIGGRYVLTEAGKITEVTAKLAEELQTKAVMLYRPLPSAVRSISGLLRFGIRSNRRDLWMFAWTAALAALVGLLVPVMTGQVLGTFVAQAQRGLIVQGSLVVIGSALVVAALSIVQNIAVLRIESRSTAAMQVGVWTKLLSLPTSFFTRYSTGELGTTVLGVSAAQEMLSGMMTSATLGFITGSANLVLVYFYDLRLALLATVLVLVGAVFALVAGRIEVRWQRKLYAHEQKLSSRVFQLLTAVPKLRVTAAEDRVFGVWASELAKGRSLAAASRRVQNIVTTFNAGFPLVCSVIIFAVIGGPLQGQVPIAAFLSFFAAFNLLLASSLQFTSAAITAMGVVPLLEKLRPILETAPEVDRSKAAPGDLSGRLDLSRVSFRYGDDGPLVLDDVTLSIAPGEFVAIVGSSGSGKSTVLRLLLGFEQPVSGTVLYDGQDLAELEVSAVRRQCGVVLQNGSLLAGDIKANIIGSSSHTLDDAWVAASMAGISDDISAMPMGMNTVLSEGTNTLSGGQRQRLMIARALVARPRIVFFDEATSALDNPTQRLVAESTRKLSATRIVIAHRLSTVADADKVIVLDQGRIVQQGRYEELLADENGLFARLASRQVS